MTPTFNAPYVPMPIRKPKLGSDHPWGLPAKGCPTCNLLRRLGL